MESLWVITTKPHSIDEFAVKLIGKPGARFTFVVTDDFPNVLLDKPVKTNCHRALSAAIPLVN